MLQTARPKQKSQPKAPAPEKYLEAFRWMLLTRTFEEKLASMYRGGRITGGVYIGKGQEAVSVACGIFYRKEISSRLSFVIRPAGRPLANRWSMSHAHILVRARDRCEDAMATFTAANHATASSYREWFRDRRRGPGNSATKARGDKANCRRRSRSVPKV